jgi:flagellar protein FliS
VLSQQQAKQVVGSYGAASVSTVTPAALVLMLFDGALRFIARAEHGFDHEVLSRRNEEVHNNLTRARAVIRELQVSLDMEAGGEFSAQMFALYDFMIAQLLAADIRKEKVPIQNVAVLLSDIRNAWAEMTRKFQSEGG